MDHDMKFNITKAQALNKIKDLTKPTSSSYVFWQKQVEQSQTVVSTVF